MAAKFNWISIIFFSIVCFPARSIILVIPDDVPAGFATIFGFTPRFVKGNDHRFGWGFSLGNQADFQVMYELGPQTYTKPLQTVRARSVTYRERVRRRPFLEFLLNLGLFNKEVSYRFDVANEIDNEPRNYHYYQCTVQNSMTEIKEK